MLGAVEVAEWPAGSGEGDWAQWCAGFVSFVHAQAAKAWGVAAFAPREVWVPNFAAWAQRDGDGMARLLPAPHVPRAGAHPAQRRHAPRVG